MYKIYSFKSSVGEFVFFDDYCDSSVKTCLDAFINCLDDQPFEMLDYRAIVSTYKMISKTSFFKECYVFEVLNDSGDYEYFKVVKFC